MNNLAINKKSSTELNEIRPNEKLLKGLLENSSVNILVLSSSCSTENLSDVLLGTLHYMKNVDKRIKVLILVKERLPAFLNMLLESLDIEDNVTLINETEDNQDYFTALLGSDAVIFGSEDKDDSLELSRTYSLIPVLISKEDRFCIKDGGVLEIPGSDQNFAVLFKMIKERDYVSF